MLTPSLNLGCIKTVFKNLEDQIFCQNNEWHFPKYSVEHQYVQIPVGPLPCPTPLQETGFSTAALWRCLASLSSNKDRRHKKKNEFKTWQDENKYHHRNESSVLKATEYYQANPNIQI